MSKKPNSIHKSGALGLLLAQGAENDTMDHKQIDGDSPDWVIEEDKNLTNESSKSSKQKSSQKTRKQPQNEASVESIISIDPNTATLWKYKDRQPFERRDPNEFAKNLIDNGQLVPVIARLSQQSGFEYEIIAGEQRWSASKAARQIRKDFTLKVIVKKLSDEEAFVVQAIENKDRDPVSPYSESIVYKKMIDDGIITRLAIASKLNKPKQRISEILSFTEVPAQIWNAVGDMSKVSTSSASEIRRLAKQGEEYISALISIATKIRDGAGKKTIKKIVEDAINLKPKNNTAVEVVSVDNRKLFTWRRDSNNNISISFPKDIRGWMDIPSLEQAIIKEFDLQFKNRKSDA